MTTLDLFKNDLLDFEKRLIEAINKKTLKTDIFEFYSQSNKLKFDFDRMRLCNSVEKQKIQEIKEMLDVLVKVCIDIYNDLLLKK